MENDIDKLMTEYFLWKTQQQPVGENGKRS